MSGMVYLVGAGPGDYRLISLKAIECMQRADVVVYDRLADERLLAHVPVLAEKIYVGKASSCHTMRQEDINQLLVDLSRQGKTVVRLKGGDPFVFGRGGEEALLLQENSLPFEIIPGVTSAISVPAYAGIPVTHRGVAASFAVVTGHEDPGKEHSSMRWDKLATAVDTLVFLMGVENLPHITAKLIENGRAPDTPAAVIRWGTKPEQRVLVTTVGKAAEQVRLQGIKPPAIFIVGNVVQLREKLAWFDRRQLFGKTILVTRSREQASVLMEKLEDLGATCLEAPAIRVVPPASYERLDEAIAQLHTYAWIIFTSVNGVKYFFERLTEKGLDSRAIAGKVAAIGASTAKALRTYGILADLVPAEFRAEGVAEALQSEIEPGMKILIPRAKIAREALPEKLASFGAAVTVAEAYETITGEADAQQIRELLQQGKIDLVTFTSSSTVTNLLTLLGTDGAALLKDVKTACIGPVTMQTCERNGITPSVIAEEYTIDGMVEAIKGLFVDQKEER